MATTLYFGCAAQPTPPNFEVVANRFFRWPRLGVPSSMTHQLTMSSAVSLPRESSSLSAPLQLTTLEIRAAAPCPFLSLCVHFPVSPSSVAKSSAAFCSPSCTLMRGSGVCSSRNLMASCTASTPSCVLRSVSYTHLTLPTICSV
eukprot:TRINITY_DN4103_c0_g1_i5.p2 TRINITY_DN4103_c0_g1~~TRINITY_DN4103_c0_g1_i5.p2  ORF type:complete len:145 (+),score=9.30 TRINITY_DN4103_c0_g1_i5:349-783(+)